MEGPPLTTAAKEAGGAWRCICSSCSMRCCISPIVPTSSLKLKLVCSSAISCSWTCWRRATFSCSRRCMLCCMAEMTESSCFISAISARTVLKAIDSSARMDCISDRMHVAREAMSMAGAASGARGGTEGGVSA